MFILAKTFVFRQFIYIFNGKNLTHNQLHLD